MLGMRGAGRQREMAMHAFRTVAGLFATAVPAVDRRPVGQGIVRHVGFGEVIRHVAVDALVGRIVIFGMTIQADLHGIWIAALGPVSICR